MNEHVSPVGAVVRCACPRILVAAPIKDGIGKHDGRVIFPKEASHVALKVWHQPGCQAVSEIGEEGRVVTVRVGLS
jgi:hypothetical protein